MVSMLSDVIYNSEEPKQFRCHMRQKCPFKMSYVKLDFLTFVVWRRFHRKMRNQVKESSTGTYCVNEIVTVTILQIH